MANASTNTSAAPSQETLSSEAMRFVERLAADVAGDAIELPSYPEVALRVQRVLVDVNAGTERVVKVVSSEPMLASRILNVANSAAMNRNGKQVSDLRAAAMRVGFDTLRTVAIGFAVAQLRKAAAFRSIDKPMNQLWQQSVGIAAMSFVLSRKLQRFVPDVAMLAGLVSGVGKLYILTRSTQYPGLFSDPVSYHSVEREWHPQVARSILENWKLAPQIIEAVGDMEEAAVDDRGAMKLADLLSAAQLLHTMKGTPEVLDAALSQNNACLRLGLTAASCQTLLAESEAELASLTDALGK